MANMIPIVKTILSSTSSTITFTSIPQGYTDLLLNVSLRINAVGVADRAIISFNGSNADYTLKWLGVAGSNAVSYTRTDWGDNQTSYHPANTSTISTFSNTSFYFSNYSGNKYKNLAVDNTSEDNSGTTTYYGILTGLWSQTSPITSITLTNSNGFLQYSSAILYGIRKY